MSESLFDEWGERCWKLGLLMFVRKKNFAVLHYVICMLDNKRDLKILRQKPVILFMMLRDFLNLGMWI